jgi:hypothetical protein
MVHGDNGVSSVAVIALCVVDCKGGVLTATPPRSLLAPPPTSAKHPAKIVQIRQWLYWIHF